MKIVIRIALSAFAAMFGTLSALADEALTPTSAQGVQVISVNQALELLGKVPFFDFRSALNFGKSHIKGAVALPYDPKSEKSVGFDASKDKFDMAKLPRDKSSPVVFYSDGPSGWKSYKAAVLAHRAGYSNVKWMRDGTNEWFAKGLPVE